MCCAGLNGQVSEARLHDAGREHCSTVCRQLSSTPQRMQALMGPALHCHQIDQQANEACWQQPMRATAPSTPRIPSTTTDPYRRLVQQRDAQQRRRGAVARGEGRSQRHRLRRVARRRLRLAVPQLLAIAADYGRRAVVEPILRAVGGVYVDDDPDAVAQTCRARSDEPWSAW